MRWWHLGWTALRLAGPSFLAPWRSPLVRWRMETYGFRLPDGSMGHAADVTPARFLQFIWAHRRALASFARWAAALERI